MKNFRRIGRQVRVAHSDPKPARLFTPHSFATQVELIGGIPMVYVRREAYSRMWHFADIAKQEVGWLGTVQQTRHGNLLIEEVFLLEQEVSGAQTEISENGIAKLAQELIETREDGVEVANRIRFWGHSHVEMGTSPSQQDESQMQHFEQNDCPWFVRGIVNRLGRMRFDVFLWDIGAKIVDVPWAIYDEFVDMSLREEIEVDFKAKVTTRTYVVPQRQGSADSYQLWQPGQPIIPGSGVEVKCSTDGTEGSNVG